MQGSDLKEEKKLSPGFFYLEQVCQMLENLAREQMRSQGLLMETDALWEHEEAEVRTRMSESLRNNSGVFDTLTTDNIHGMHQSSL